MKKFLEISFILLLVSACGRDPIVPPAPVPVPTPGPKPVDPVLVFTSMGKNKTAKIEGKLKAGAKYTAEEAKKLFDIAVQLLEK
jgi:hypothetical protein